MGEENISGQTTEGSRGVFNYLEAGVESSLLRNGKVLTVRDTDGNDGGTQGVRIAQHDFAVQNARVLPGDRRPTLRRNGFELVDHPVEPGGVDFLDHKDVVENYYKQCAHLVAEQTGAEAFAFDHNVRSVLGKESKQRIRGGQQVQAPAHVVHGDYTLTGAPQRLRDLSDASMGSDAMRRFLGGESLLSSAQVKSALSSEGRFGIINVWRNIAFEPVATNPIALCDSQTVAPEDLVVFEIHYADRVGENYFAKHAGRHRWYYYPEITRDEALLIKQWDSAGALARSGGALGDGFEPDEPCTFSFHSAFEDQMTPPDAPDRWSIEVRCIVIYP